MANLPPSWPAPPNIRALTTNRASGYSLPPFDTNNLGLHVGDNAAHVKANRKKLIETLQLPNEPEWLEQTHSTCCIVVEDEANRRADAAISRTPQTVLAIMTADCLPILLCNRQGTEIAAIHAGWKGLVDGIIESTVTKMQSPSSDILAWSGPAICLNCFEIGEEVREMYINKYPYLIKCFERYEQKWKANLPQIMEKIFHELNISNVYHSNVCTFEKKNEFYSYRREQQTGRMATLIWFNN